MADQAAKDRYAISRELRDFSWKNCTHDHGTLDEGRTCDECAYEFIRQDRAKQAASHPAPSREGETGPTVYTCVQADGSWWSTYATRWAAEESLKVAPPGTRIDEYVPAAALAAEREARERAEREGERMREAGNAMHDLIGGSAPLMWAATGDQAAAHEFEKAIVKAMAKWTEAAGKAHG